jgi:hypothetical protein
VKKLDLAMVILIVGILIALAIMLSKNNDITFIEVICNCTENTTTLQ